MPHPDAWTCTVCGAQHAVPSLVRRCEQSHTPTVTAAGRTRPDPDDTNPNQRKVTGL